MAERSGRSAERHARAAAIFLEVRLLPEPERRRRLAAATEHDVALREEVESLLDHDAATLEGAQAVQRTSPAAPWSELPAAPARIGPYRVIERIGRGGSGFVLLAEQDEPVRRRVAIKIVPQAAVSAELAARFEVERRSLECTDHPNIARVLDAGRTADGLPYLVMDYVEGAPITTYCDERGLGLRARIELMLDVLDAVQHAHMRGVIHRDLKPANVLVAENDGRPTPRVLDFGIAKPIAGTFPGESPPTAGLPIGTPAYMAPEQTGGEAIDTRADVYALGAMVYELVCGQPPIDATGNPLDVLRRIRDVMPGSAASVRRRRADRFARDPVSASVLGDLDCVLAKALEKSPARRYATVAAFADDLRRLLRREPVSARPPSLRYRAARFAQRNRVLVASSAAMVAIVLAAIAGLALGLFEAQRQRADAEAQRDAQQEITLFLTDDLLAAASPDIEGEHVTALDLLRRASRRVDERFADRPLIAAAIHHTLGNAFAELAAYDEADPHVQQAIMLRQAAAGRDAPDTVHSEILAASLLARRQKLEEAEAALRAAIHRARLILGADDPDLYAALNDLGVVLETLGRLDEAAPVLEEALVGRTRLLGPRDREVLATLNNLALVFDRRGDTERSLTVMKEALDIAEALPDTPIFTVLGLENNIGATYQDLDRDEEAAPHLRRAAALAEEHLGADHEATLTLRANLAGLETDLGDPERGALLYEAVIQARVTQLGPDAPDTLTARYGYWDSVRKARRAAEAAEGFAVLAADVDRTLGADHWLAGTTRAALARALFESARPEEALAQAERAVERLVATYGADHARARAAVAVAEEIRSSVAARSAAGE